LVDNDSFSRQTAKNVNLCSETCSKWDAE